MDVKSGMNYAMDEEGTRPMGGKSVDQANRESSSGNPLSAAVALVRKHNERADHDANPMHGNLKE